MKYLSFLSDFNGTSVFSTDFRKILILNFMKIRVVRAELFHEDGQADMKLTVAFRNISKASKNGLSSIKRFKFKV